MRLTKEAQLKVLEEGAYRELSEREDLYPEVVVKVLVRLTALGRHDRAREVARKHPVPPEGIRVLPEAEDPQSVLEGIRLGLYAREISFQELEKAWRSLPEKPPHL